MLCVLLCLSLSFQNVVVFPSRTAAIENALRLFSPNLAIVDELLTRNLPRQWMTSLAIEVQPVYDGTSCYFPFFTCIFVYLLFILNLLDFIMVCIIITCNYIGPIICCFLFFFFFLIFLILLFVFTIHMHLFAFCSSLLGEEFNKEVRLV